MDLEKAFDLIISKVHNICDNTEGICEHCPLEDVCDNYGLADVPYKFLESLKEIII